MANAHPDRINEYSGIRWLTENDGRFGPCGTLGVHRDAEGRETWFRHLDVRFEELDTEITHGSQTRGGLALYPTVSTETDLYYGVWSPPELTSLRDVRAILELLISEGLERARVLPLPRFLARSKAGPCCIEPRFRFKDGTPLEAMRERGCGRELDRYLAPECRTAESTLVAPALESEAAKTWAIGQMLRLALLGRTWRDLDDVPRAIRRTRKRELALVARCGHANPARRPSLRELRAALDGVSFQELPARAPGASDKVLLWTLPLGLVAVFWLLWRVGLLS